MILMSYDGSADAQAAIDRLAHVMPGATVTVLTVWEPFMQTMARTGMGMGVGFTGGYSGADAESVDEGIRQRRSRPQPMGRSARPPPASSRSRGSSHATATSPPRSSVLPMTLTPTSSRWARAGAVARRRSCSAASRAPSSNTPIARSSSFPRPSSQIAGAPRSITGPRTYERGPALVIAPAPWHSTPGADAIKTLHASPAGLTAAEARERLTRYGPNRLPEAVGRTAVGLLLDQVRTPLMWALLAAGALALALGEIEDGLVVLAVVVLNALIGFAQEYRAGRAIAALAELVAEPARVRRDGAWLEIPAEQVVPGDLLEVGQGDRVAADLRLLDDGGAARAGGGADRGVRAGRQGRRRRRGGRRRSPNAAACSTPAPSSLRAAGRGVTVATGLQTELGRISALLDGVDPLRDAAHARSRALRPRDHGRDRRCGAGARRWSRSCADSPSPTPRWPASAWPSPRSPRACPRS